MGQLVHNLGQHCLQQAQYYCQTGSLFNWLNKIKLNKLKYVLIAYYMNHDEFISLDRCGNMFETLLEDYTGVKNLTIKLIQDISQSIAGNISIYIDC